MGRGTGGVKGMNVSRGKNWVLAMDVARDDDELLVVTENGFGKRTAIAEYPRKGRGSMGVKTIALTDRKGGLAAALIVREHQDLVFISQSGMVQRTSVKGISRYGRSSQGVKVMNIRDDDDSVSAVAVVVEDSPDTAAAVADELPSTDAAETTSQPPDLDVSAGADDDVEALADDDAEIAETDDEMPANEDDE
jgi:DNA gyrase subunit A